MMPLSDEVLRRRAVEQLRIALRDPKGDLACDWAHRDPDLDSIRDEDDSDWRLVTCSYCGGANRRRGTSPAVGGHSVTRAAAVGRHLSGARLPRGPWGPPELGFGAWMALALAAIAAVIAAAGDGLLVAALGLVAAFAIVRAGLCSIASDRIRLPRSTHRNEDIGVVAGRNEARSAAAARLCCPAVVVASGRAAAGAPGWASEARCRPGSS